MSKLRAVPHHFLSLGAGVQSSTESLMASHGEITPMPECGVFADTQAEPTAVYHWLNYLCGAEVKHRKVERLGKLVDQAYVDPGIYTAGVIKFPIHIITRGNLTDRMLKVNARKDGKGFYSQDNIPAFTVNRTTGKKGIIPRQCTWTFKVTILDQHQRAMVGPDEMKAWRKKHYPALKVLGAYNSAMKKWKREAKEAKRIGDQPPTRPRFPAMEWAECQADPLAVTWLGISYDEVSRIKQPRHPWQNFRYPLIDLKMRRHNCIDWMKANGYPEPPRSACVYCPYHSDEEWIRLKREEPKSFAEAVRVDYKLREVKALTYGMNSTPYLHASRVPLDQVDFNESQGKLAFNNECEGHCGV